jgi:hypothetical protein
VTKSKYFGTTPKIIKISLMRKLRGDRIRLMEATIQLRALPSLTCYQKSKRSKYVKFQLYLWFCMCVIYEEHRLRVFENRVLRSTPGPMRHLVMGIWKNCIMRTAIAGTQIS